MRNNGMECTVRMVGGTEIAEFGMSFDGDLLGERRSQARFADSCLAAKQYDLTLARSGPMPASEQPF